MGQGSNLTPTLTPTLTLARAHPQAAAPPPPPGRRPTLTPHPQAAGGSLISRSSSRAATDGALRPRTRGYASGEAGGEG